MDVRVYLHGPGRDCVNELNIDLQFNRDPSHNINAMQMPLKFWHLQYFGFIPVSLFDVWVVWLLAPDW